MAEHTKFITIDPNGDTLLKLKNIRWKLPEWIDEETRFRQPVDVTGLALEDIEAEGADESDQRKHPEEVHFLVSSRQLRLVSTYFDTIFKKNFTESVPNPEDGKFHIWADEWNPNALGRLLNIAHAQISDIPNCSLLIEVVEMALIVDYYDMHQAPHRYVKDQFSLWTSVLGPGNKRGRSLAFGHEAIKMMFLSFVFKDVMFLKHTTGVAMKNSKGPLQDLGLPLGDIPGTVAHLSTVCNLTNASQTRWKSTGSKLSTRSSKKWTI